ncbi:hypothetical protein KBB27_01230, partial [Patescibacteria group bacterium]|nr:hypothetical protein [Patescibacteria group bacterium]
DTRYAIQSILSQYLWEYVKRCHVAEKPIPAGPNFWEEFYDQVITDVGRAGQRITGACQHPRHPSSPNFPLTRLDQLFQGFIYCKERETGEQGTGFPSMDGLFHFGLHLLQVVAEKYEQDTGEVLPEDVFMRCARHPSLKRILIDLQMNTHVGIFVIHQVLTGQKVDPSKVGQNLQLPFMSDYFSLDGETGEVKTNPALWFKVQNQLTLLGMRFSLPNEQRNCPMIYAGFFDEMWQWLVNLTSYQLYATEYPSVFKRASIASKSSQLVDRIQADLVRKSLIEEDSV